MRKEKKTEELTENTQGISFKGLLKTAQRKKQTRGISGKIWAGAKPAGGTTVLITKGTNVKPRKK